MPPPKRTKVSVFIGTSLDGFIARENGELDWLIGGTDITPEEYGYNAFIKDIDVIVMGRRTYEVGLSFDPWPYHLPVFVLSHRPIEKPKTAPTAKVESMAGEPETIVATLAKKGLRRLYVDGGETIRQFLRAGLVDEITISQLPVLIGRGIPLFGPLPHDVKLRHIKTSTFRGGMVQTTYEVDKQATSLGRKTGPRAMPASKGAPEKDFEERFPNLAAQKAADREEHVRRAMQAGMTRKQAEKHADEEIEED